MVQDCVCVMVKKPYRVYLPHKEGGYTTQEAYAKAVALILEDEDHLDEDDGGMDMEPQDIGPYNHYEFDYPNDGEEDEE